MKLSFQKKIKICCSPISLNNLRILFLIIVKSADITIMRLVPSNIKKLFNRRRSLLLTPILLILLLFQFLTPENTELTAAASEKQSPDPEIVQEPQEQGLVNLEKVQTELESGGTFQNLMLNAGVDYEEAYNIIQEVSPLIDLTRMKAGQKVDLYFQGSKVKKVVLPVSIDREIRVELKDEKIKQYSAESFLKDLSIYPMRKEFNVESSIYQSALDAGIPNAIIMDLIQLFSFDVDFARDIQKGDHFTALYELIYDEYGNVVDTGEILEASLKNNGKDFRIYRFTSLDGKTDYYDENGHTVRKTLLKTPINGAYITSSYGMRTNPFSGFNTMHKGVDFGAPRGTPIKASGDGTVVYAGWSDIYGNYIMLRHINHYETVYAHMTSFARGIRRGARVDQGQVIGYVGSTGMSTGPHLHYEVRYYGKQVNPSTVKFPPGRILVDEELRLFQNLLQSRLASF